LTGLEFACGIPGTVGGAVIINAGAYGGEIKDVLVSARIIENGEIVEKTVTPEKMGYRSSIFSDNGSIVLSRLSGETHAKAVNASSYTRAYVQANESTLDVPSRKVFKRRRTATLELITRPAERARRRADVSTNTLVL
jgi:UDP-N-acetylmuramate dehydrogenase